MNPNDKVRAAIDTLLKMFEKRILIKWLELCSRVMISQRISGVS